ncbi:MAG TPA: hypothetical protein VE092_21495 [Herbaspirillum sp.]|uniref:hypothetical protein n=1 Tax=Herbaspirillum sp. TaxID=1890675 RepID=UPI002D3119FD|nr:hypothetical protein [Herbaspirillum sp.]HZG22591.1 hypothetical protein [Herbaspirillum sp.]
MPIPSHPPVPDPHATARRLPLGRGEHRQLWLPAGSQLLCHAPLLRVTEAAQWQVDRLVSRQSRLADGECLLLQHDGWVGVLAPQGGELLCLVNRRQRWHAPLLTLWRRLGGWRHALNPSRAR